MVVNNKQNISCLNKKKNTILDWNFSLRSQSRLGKVTEIYFVIMLLFYPMLLIDIDILGIPVKNLIFYTLTTVLCICYIITSIRNKAKLQKGKSIQHLFLFVLGITNLITIVFKIVKGQADYATNLLLLMFVCLYFIFSSGVVFYRYYLNLLLFSGGVIFIELLFYYLGSTELGWVLDIILTNKHITSSYIMLIMLVAVVEYCLDKASDSNKIYLLLFSLGAFLLFLTDSKVSILICALSLFAITIFYTPTVSLVKRAYTLLFLFFFIWSNMSLITSYTNVIKTEVHFELIHSVYMELMLAVCAVFFFTYWDKLSEREVTEDEELPIFSKVSIAAIGIMCSICMLGILGTEKFAENAKGEIAAILMNFLSGIEKELSGMESGYIHVLSDYGITGSLIMLLTAAYFIKKAKEIFHAWDKEYLIIITIAFAIQFVLYEINIVTTPIYFLLTLCALFGKRERKPKRKIYIEETD